MDNSKDNKETGSLFLALNIIPLFYFLQRESIIFNDILFAISLSVLILLFYLYFKNKFENIHKLSLLLFFHLILFPIAQIIAYNNDSNSFKFSENFISQKKHQAELELKKFDNIYLLEDIFKSETDSTLNVTITSDYIGSNILTDNSIISIFKQPSQGRPNDRNGSDYTPLRAKLISKKNQDYFLLNLDNESINDAAQREFHRAQELQNQLMSPMLEIKSKDFWLESISGYLLGNIKPISQTSQIIQLIQILTLSIIGIVYAEIIVNSSFFTVKRKN